MYYKCHNINPNCGGSYRDSPDRIKNNNPINKKDNKCFQHAVMILAQLNHKRIKKHQQRITKIKPLIDKYNWDVINYPSEKDDWKNFEKKI